MKHRNDTRTALGLFIVLFQLTAIPAQLKSKEKPLWDIPYQKFKTTSDLKSAPSIKLTQLYSRNSGKHVRVLPGQRIDARGNDGDKYAKLFFESDGFGRVRIKGAETSLYICVHKRNKSLRTQRKGRGRKNCVWQETLAPNGYTELRSARYKGLLLAFSKNGKRRGCTCSKRLRSGMEHVQFLQRPWSAFRPYRGRHRRINRKLGRGKYVTSDEWKKWRISLK